MINLLITGFVIGLSSSFHCIGMCGPLALIAPIERKNKYTEIRDTLTYNFGRLISYSFLGFIVGVLGLSFTLLLSGQYISIIFGTLMLLFAIQVYYPFFTFQSKITDQLTIQIGRIFSKLKSYNLAYPAVLFGIINGFLPCAMVYFGLLNAMSSHNNLISIYAMIAFGIGTMPAMLALGFIKQKKIISKLYFKKAVPFLLIIAALLTILRGLGLGIPLISPSITDSNSSHQNPKMECCKAPK